MHPPQSWREGPINCCSELGDSHPSWKETAAPRPGGKHYWAQGGTIQRHILEVLHRCVGHGSLSLGSLSYGHHQRQWPQPHFFMWGEGEMVPKALVPG